jgi:cobalt-zinc-cadmium efflux system protein
MSHSHHHTHSGESKLLAATLLNVLITLVEIVGGLFSNSIALLSDALHNLGDAFAVFLSYLAMRVSQRDSDDRKTFGYKRVEILAALFNTTVLIVIVFFLFFEAWHRLNSPQPVKAGIMLVVAAIGLLANLYAVFLLKKESKEDLNTKSAYLHMLGDTFSSGAVIVGGLVMYYFHYYWIDPAITFLVGIYMLKETYHVLIETLDILMQSSPRNLDLGKVKLEIEKIPEIDNIHHVHVWKLTDHQTYFECHIDLKDNLTISEAGKVREKMEKLLKSNFAISHFTVQFEFDCCKDKEMIHKAV